MVAGAGLVKHTSTGFCPNCLEILMQTTESCYQVSVCIDFIDFFFVATLNHLNYKVVCNICTALYSLV